MLAVKSILLELISVYIRGMKLQEVALLLTGWDASLLQS